MAGENPPNPEGNRLLRTAIATLVSLEAHYPFGTPRGIALAKKNKPIAQAVNQNESDPEGDNGVRYVGPRPVDLVFVRGRTLNLPQLDPWEDSGGILLSAAIEKGFGRKITTVGHLVFTAVSSNVLDFQNIFIELAPATVVLLGADAHKIAVAPYVSKIKTVVCALDPEDVAKAPTLKRQFWEELRPLVSRGSA